EAVLPSIAERPLLDERVARLGWSRRGRGSARRGPTGACAPGFLLKKGQKSRERRGLAHFISNRRRRTMTMQTVSLSSLEPGRGNPRKAMDRNGLEGLAASIRNDGLWQHLVV